MFEKDLEEKLKGIFEAHIVKFEMPGEHREQDVLFVEVEKAKTDVKDGRVHARVTGRCYFFAQAEKLPFGYFEKCIKAHPGLTKDFFFYEIDENTRLYQNIVQRTFAFMYFFDSQYDPEIGTIESVEIEVEINE